MKCAECGRENQTDARFCCYCAVPLVKEPVVSDTGSALRKIYNDFGYEKVFEDHRYITSALGDFVPDSEMISNSIEMAYRAGLGKVYEAQIRKGGKPNDVFYKRVKELITEDAGLSEKRADKIIGYFDEMLGWKTQDIPDSVPSSEPSVKMETKETIVKPVEPEKPAPVDILKPESNPEIAVSEEPVMSEPEDEVLAALADEGMRFENSAIFANPESEPNPVEILSEEDPIRSIQQEQALAELQPEEIEPVKKIEKLFFLKIISLIVVVCIWFVIIWTIAIKPSQIQESSNTQSKEVSLSKAEIGSQVIFGSYEQDNDTSNGKEDIEWIVLAREGDRILVISKYALDCQKYNTSNIDVTWETCSLRKWLNETFLNTAFSSEERGKISVVTVSDDKNNATTDQVFLLSIKEANRYFSSDSARACQGTTYCYAKGAYMAGNGNCWWWLRSPGYSSDCAAGVDIDGCVDYDGYYVSYGSNAVRPALWINIGS